MKIAVVKYAGLADSGTERYLREIAKILVAIKGFEVTYFYCRATPYLGSSFVHPQNVDSYRHVLTGLGVECIEFEVRYKDVRFYDHLWRSSNFFEVFSEDKFDCLIIGRGGREEYPINYIRKVPIIETIHLDDGFDTQRNIYATVCLSEGSYRRFRMERSLKRNIHHIPAPISPIGESTLSTNVFESYRTKYAVIYGFTQRDNPELFSFELLEAFKDAQLDDCLLLIAGGSQLYSDYARKIGLKNFFQLAGFQPRHIIEDLYRVLDVFCHWRPDGEIAPAVIVEALSCGVPVITFGATRNTGQIEFVAQHGIVAFSKREYEEALLMMRDEAIRNQFSSGSKDYVLREFSPRAITEKWVNLLTEASRTRFREGFFSLLRISVLRLMKRISSIYFHYLGRVF